MHGGSPEVFLCTSKAGKSYHITFIVVLRPGDFLGLGDVALAFNFVEKISGKMLLRGTEFLSKFL